MKQPTGATHQSVRNGNYYKQESGKVYVRTIDGRWIESIGGSIDDHEFIRPLGDALLNQLQATERKE